MICDSQVAPLLQVWSPKNAPTGLLFPDILWVKEELVSVMSDLHNDAIFNWIYLLNLENHWYYKLRSTS